METIESIVLSLSDLLEADRFDSELIESLVTSLNELCNSRIMRNYEFLESLNSSFHPRIILLDFEAHNEKKLGNARFWKIRKTKLFEYEAACNMRDLEKECMKYLEFKKQYGFEKSAFVLLQDFIIYAYFGTAKNDLLIREFLDQKMGIKNLKIGYLVTCLKHCHY